MSVGCFHDPLVMCQQCTAARREDEALFSKALDLKAASEKRAREIAGDITGMIVGSRPRLAIPEKFLPR